MEAAVIRLHPGAQDNVVFDDTTRFPYSDVEKFIVEAEKLPPVTLYCLGLAAMNGEPLGKNYAEYFPSEHPWLVDEYQEMVAKRLVRFFYHPRYPRGGSSAKMLKIEGVISKFRFEFPNRRMELMNLFEGII